MNTVQLIGYIPILTTLVSIAFLAQIGPHYLQKRQATYLLWWTIGVLTFGLGTLAESVHALFGWNEVNVRFWYVVGALLGGFPLAQGTVYLLAPRKWADVSAVVFSILIAVGAVCVFLTPISLPEGFDYRLTGKVFSWTWVRAFSPFINIYSFIFLVGGAVYSARQYARLGRTHSRFLGNVFIAIGGLLPGIGGSATRFGAVEVLFVTELIGLICMYIGYRIMRTDGTVTIHPAQQKLA